MSERDPTLPGNCTLDHDGCVVCSDAGIPVRVISIEGDDALCEDAVRQPGRDSHRAGNPRTDRRSPPDPRRRRHRQSGGETEMLNALSEAGARQASRRRSGAADRREAPLKYVSEFRDAELARAVAAEIASVTDPDRHYKLMEVCGGHTHTIYRHGIKDLLPDQVELVHGPGCPVCVLPMGRVDEGIEIAERPEVIFTCFGDMMRVPGSKGNLLEVKAQGRRHPDGLLAARRPAHSAREPGPRGRLLRHRLRDHRALHRAHPATGQEGRASRTSPSSATTSPSSRRCGRSSTPRTSASTRLSGRGTSRR